MDIKVTELIWVIYENECLDFKETKLRLKSDRD